MSENTGKKGVNILGVDLIRGYIEVQYTYEVDDIVYDPIWLTIEMPFKKDKLDDKDKEELIKFVKKRYPLQEFLNFRAAKKLGEQDEPFFDQNKIYEVIDEDLSNELPEEKTPQPVTMDSIYGSVEEVARIRHIILDTLAEVGLLK